MMVTLCYVDDRKPIVFEGVVSEDDRRRTEAMYPGSVIRWEETEA